MHLQLQLEHAADGAAPGEHCRRWRWGALLRLLLLHVLIAPRVHCCHHWLSAQVWCRRLLSIRRTLFGRAPRFGHALLPPPRRKAEKASLSSTVQRRRGSRGAVVCRRGSRRGWRRQLQERIAIAHGAGKRFMPRKVARVAPRHLHAHGLCHGARERVPPTAKRLDAELSRCQWDGAAMQADMAFVPRGAAGAGDVQRQQKAAVDVQGLVGQGLGAQEAQARPRHERVPDIWGACHPYAHQGHAAGCWIV